MNITNDSNFTPATVPELIRTKPINNAQLYLDVQYGGTMAGVKLSDAEAMEKGLIKNHWLWRVHVPGNTAKDSWGIRFGMDVDSVEQDAGSDVVRHGGSSTGTVSNGPGEAAFSDISSQGKPPPVDKGEYFTGDVTRQCQPPEEDVFSEVGSQGKPPLVDKGKSAGDIVSKAGSLGNVPDIHELSWNSGMSRPVPGSFNVKVRNWAMASQSVYITFPLSLKDGLTFGDLLDALTNMEPFHLRMIGPSYFGCRDFIFNSAATFIAREFTNGQIVDNEGEHIFDILSWRYSKANPDTPGTEPVKSTPGLRRARSPIDRAVWPPGFVAHVDGRVEIR